MYKTGFTQYHFLINLFVLCVDVLNIYSRECEREINIRNKISFLQAFYFKSIAIVLLNQNRYRNKC